MKVLDKRVWKWNTHDFRIYQRIWFCYFTKYGVTSRLIRISKGSDHNE
jgi:hypothetical protein